MKSLVGLLAIVAALWVFSDYNRSKFRRDLFMLCLGHVGDGPVVTADEKSACECMADSAVGALPVRSRLPQSMIHLSADDNARMVEAQKSCAPAAPPIRNSSERLSGTASPARTGDLWIHNPAL